MVRIGRLVVIGGMTTRASIWRVGIIAVVAGGTIRRNRRVCAIQRVIIVVNSKGCWRPAGRRMAAGTIRRERQCRMAGVAALIVIGHMATRTIGRRARVPRCMALRTIYRQVRPRQRKIRFAVVEHIRRVAARVAGQASRAVIGITVDPAVLVVGGRVGMAAGASELGVIAGIAVTIGAFTPGPLVRPAVDREIIRIMLAVFRRHPVDVGGMAIRAIFGKMRLRVVRVSRGRIIRLVARNTIRAGIGIIAARMAFGAIGYSMPFGEREKIVFDLVRRPILVRHVVALHTIGGESGAFVIRVGSSGIIHEVTIHTGISNAVEPQARF